MKRTDFQHFYVNPANVQPGRLRIDGDEFHHAVKVLRKRPGDALTAVDGQGALYYGVIESIEKDAVVLNILAKEIDVGEPRLKLTLALSPLKGDHFDLAVEKATELGVTTFQPIVCERSIAGVESRLGRWRHKALTAMKQCGRSVCPTVKRAVPFEDLFAEPFELVLIAHEDADTPIGAYRDDLRSTVAVLIGPEGGFSDREFNFALEHGAKPLSLGNRRLRSETAALAATVQVMSAAKEI